MSTAKAVISYSGVIAFDGITIGTRVNRFDLFEDDLIAFDWITPPASPDGVVLRLLGIAAKQSDGTYKSPRINFIDLDGVDIVDTTDDGAKITFQIALSGNELRVTGEWLGFDGATYPIKCLLTKNN